MAVTDLPTPSAFLTVRAQLTADGCAATSLCAGYERGAWREQDFVAYLFSYLIEFAFKWSRLREVNSATASAMIEEAAKRIYDSDKFKHRGEFGELLLHAALRNHFNSEAAVAKIFYKSGDNDTVKGFDCVHVVEGIDGLELWLGEAKFYSNAAQALGAALKSLDDLLDTRRFKRELTIIRGAVDDTWPYAAAFRALTEGKSLDEVFPILRIPILLTYNSPAVRTHEGVTPEYEEELREEVETVFNRFQSKSTIHKEIFVHLILVPLFERDQFAAALHKRLREYQGK
jgi:hypothetical protein